MQYNQKLLLQYPQSKPYSKLADSLEIARSKLINILNSPKLAQKYKIFWIYKKIHYLCHSKLDYYTYE